MHQEVPQVERGSIDDESFRQGDLASAAACVHAQRRAGVSADSHYGQAKDLMG